MTLETVIDSSLLLPLNGPRVENVLSVVEKIDFLLLKSHYFISRAILLALIPINIDVMSKLDISSTVTDKSPSI